MIATQKGHREIVQLLLGWDKIKADIRSGLSTPERPLGAGLEVKDRNGQPEEDGEHLRTAENRPKRVNPNRAVILV